MIYKPKRNRRSIPLLRVEASENTSKITRTSGVRGSRLSEEARAGLVFVSPFLLGFVIFTAGPLLFSLYLSFTAYDVLNPPKWIGLANYQRMFSDVRFSKTLFNTVYFTLLHVPRLSRLRSG